MLRKGAADHGNTRAETTAMSSIFPPVYCQMRLEEGFKLGTTFAVARTHLAFSFYACEPPT